MSADGREPGAKPTDGELAGAPVTAREAATVVLLRGGTDELEVLLVKRTPHARFMAGCWVFPGGALNPEDGAGQPGLQAAARRELREEAGIELIPGTPLTAFARWITPAGASIRFDTWFYLAQAPADAVPEPDGSEIVDFRWLSPAEALRAGETGELLLAFPQRKQLQQLATFDSADALLAHARASTVVPVQPRIVGSGEQARIVLPGDPDY